MQKTARILVTGGHGLLGSALCRLLNQDGYTHLLVPCRSELDLLDYSATLSYFDKHKPTHVFHLAACVYGIQGNIANAGHSFLSNTLINTHTVEACRRTAVSKVVCMGSICAYPYPPPNSNLLREDEIFLGRPHPAEAAYAHAKRAMLAQLEAYQLSYGLDYAFVLSTNLYGPNDKFDTTNGHVVPSLVRKFVEAAKGLRQHVEVWGDGTSRRDFLYVDDAASALLLIMCRHTGPINMGSGSMHAISDIVSILCRISNLTQCVIYKPEKPKGHDCAGWDISALTALDFSPRFTLRHGLETTYRWLESNYGEARFD